LLHEEVGRPNVVEILDRGVLDRRSLGHVRIRNEDIQPIADDSIAGLNIDK
jgi:hypothetical protein